MTMRWEPPGGDHWRACDTEFWRKKTYPAFVLRAQNHSPIKINAKLRPTREPHPLPRTPRQWLRFQKPGSAMALLCVAAAASLLLLPAATLGATAYVTCGSPIKLIHAGLGVKMLANEVTYGGGGSGNLVVSSIMEGESSTSSTYWTIHGTRSEPCGQGDRIKDGQAVRIRHLPMGRWLTSTSHASPLSQSHEVSVIKAEEGDLRDNSEWIVHTDSRGEWKLGSKVYLENAASGRFLITHNVQYGMPLAHHLEVAAHPVANSNAQWVAGQGILFQGGGTMNNAKHKAGEIETYQLPDEL